MNILKQSWISACKTKVTEKSERRDGLAQAIILEIIKTGSKIEQEKAVVCAPEK